MKRTGLVVGALCSICVCFGQAQHPTEPLADAVHRIANRFDIKFSYLDKVVEGKVVTIVPGDDPRTLEERVDLLQRESLLKFAFIEGNRVVIRPFGSGDKLTLCGMVTDDTGEPLVGVTIAVSDTTHGTITAVDGSFSLAAVPFNAIITLRHVGLAVKRVPASEIFSSGCPQIKMSEGMNFLEDLVIRDYLTVGMTKQRNDVVIRPKELKILPGLIEPDILQSIQQNPGVISPYETATALHVRGGSPDQNLILWNGIKTYNQGHFFGMLSAFNPYVTDEVTFIKSGTSAKYGDRVSSVIDIRTKEAVHEKWSGGMGSNLLYADGFVRGPLIKDRVAVQVAARRSFTDYLQTPTYRQMSDRVFQNTKINEELPNDPDLAENQFFFNDHTANLTWQLSPADKITVNTIYSRNVLDFSTSDDAGSQVFEDRLRTANEGYNLKWVHISSKRFDMSVDAYFARYLLDYAFLSIENDTTEVSSKKNLIRDTGANITLAYRPGTRHQWTGGYHFSSNDIRYAFETSAAGYSVVLDQANPAITTHSLFGEHTFQNEDKTMLSTGLRVNHYAELNKTFFEPRVLVEQKITDMVFVNASGEYRTQTASQIQESVVSSLSLENQVWTLASKERFPVIDSYQVTSGINLTSGDWRVDLEGYHKQISGVTTLTFGYLNPTGNEFLRGNSAILGADVFVKRYIGNYKSWIGYSLLQTENRFFGLNDDKPFPGNWNIEHTLKWSHFYTKRNLQLSLGWIWHTGKSYTEVSADPDQQGPVAIRYGPLNSSNLPVYHRMDLSGLYDFRLSSTPALSYRVGLSILNLYNRRNLLNREFRTTPSLDNELIQTSVHSLGITPNLVLRVFW